MNSDRRERVFLVRLWQESGSSDAPAWRGSVHDVGSGHKRYISEAQEISEFVALRLAATTQTDGHQAAASSDPGRPGHYERGHVVEPDDDPS